MKVTRSVLFHPSCPVNLIYRKVDTLLLDHQKAAHRAAFAVRQPAVVADRSTVRLGV